MLGAAAQPYAASKFTFTFHANYPDGTDVVKKATVSTLTGKVTLAKAQSSAGANFAVDGYVQTGWNTKADGTGTSYAFDATATGSLTLYAVWAEGYTVTYDDGAWGQAFAAQTHIVKAGEATPAFDGTPEYAGHTFLGWEPEVAETVTGAATYKATWDPEPIPPTNNVPAKSKWLTDKEVRSMNISARAVEPLNSLNEMPGIAVSVSKYGLTNESWTIGDVEGNDVDGYTQTVTFHFKSGDALESYARNSFNTNRNLKFPVEWQGNWVYSFDHFEKDQSITFYWNGKSWTLPGASNITAAVANYIRVCLYLPKFTVTYTDGVDGVELFADQVYEKVKVDDPTPAFVGTPVREGYTFVGWDPEVAETVTEDVTYTAVWEAEEYTLVLDPANGEKPVTVTITYDNAVGDVLFVPEWEGRDLTGWVDQNGDPVAPETPYTTALEKLTATWTFHVYTVPVDPANGEDVTDVNYTYEDVIGDNYDFTTDPVWEGHTFTGWVDQDGKPVDLTATYTEDLSSITGTWKLNEYVVPVDPANGEDVTDVTYTYEDVIGDKYDFSKNPTRKGYTFQGWVDQDGNPVDLKATYTEDIQSINGSWKGKTYTVTFKLEEDEGTLSFTEKKVVNGDPLGYTPKVEREGYTFIGWYDEYGKYYNRETIFDAARDITLTGRWTKTIVPTGDDSDPALFALMMLGSLACAGAILIRLRKREDKV